MQIYTFEGKDLLSLQDTNFYRAGNRVGDTKYTFSRQCHVKTNRADVSKRREIK